MAPQLVPFLLFLHVFGAILAFGPTFAFSFMGAMAAKEPQHANFSARQSAAIGSNRSSTRLRSCRASPACSSSGRQAIRHVHTVAPDRIVLYLVALVYGLTVQRTSLHRLIELTSTPPPPGTPPGPPPPS